MTRKPRRVKVRHLVESGPARREEEDTRTDEERLADAVAEEAELRAAGVRVERFEDVVVAGRDRTRHLARVFRRDDRRVRRAQARFTTPDPLVEALASMGHLGRTMYVARKLDAERSSRRAESPRPTVIEVRDACEQGNAADVGLAVVATQREIDDVIVRPLDTPFLRDLSAACHTCPECDGALHGDEEAHVVHQGGGILVGCEGFHTALLRALVLAGRS